VNKSFIIVHLLNRRFKFYPNGDDVLFRSPHLKFVVDDKYSIGNAQLSLSLPKHNPETYISDPNAVVEFDFNSSMHVYEPYLNFYDETFDILTLNLKIIYKTCCYLEPLLPEIEIEEVPVEKDDAKSETMPDIDDDAKSETMPDIDDDAKSEKMPEIDDDAKSEKIPDINDEDFVIVENGEKSVGIVDEADKTVKKSVYEELDDVETNDEDLVVGEHQDEQSFYSDAESVGDVEEQREAENASFLDSPPELLRLIQTISLNADIDEAAAASPMSSWPSEKQIRKHAINMKLMKIIERFFPNKDDDLTSIDWTSLKHTPQERKENRARMFAKRANIDNFFDILYSGDVWKCQLQKELIAKVFLARQNFEDIVDSQGWKDLKKHRKLYDEVVEMLLTELLWKKC
jgi:hypothetical protein